MVSQASKEESRQPFPTGVTLALIILALCLGIFVMSLDNNVIATAIPKITDEFGSVKDVGWYGSAYLLTTASLQLLFGKFYTSYSVKRVFLTAIAIFELGSLICGVAQSSLAFILGRAIAGVGGAGIFTGAFTVLAYSVPLEKRPFYTGAVSSVWGISNVAGPLLGGFFTDTISWRWCFFINLPIGLATVTVIAVFFPDPDRSVPTTSWVQRLGQMDPVGNMIFMPSVICFLLALHWGGTKYAWTDRRIVSLFMVAAGLMTTFLYLQHWLQDAATVPPRIFRKRNVWTSAFFSFNLGAAFILSVYFLPIWFQAVKRTTAVESGLMNLPFLIAIVIFSLAAGGMVTLWGHYGPFMVLGTVFMAVGFGLISTFKPTTSTATWIGYQLLAGAGVGFGLQQPLMVVQVVLGVDDVPTGTAIIIFLQTLGGGIAVSIGQAVFSHRLTQRILATLPGLDPDTVLGAGALNMESIAGPGQVEGLRLAYSDAITEAFLVSAAAATATIVGSLLVEWKSVKGGAGGARGTGDIEKGEGVER